MDPMENRYKLTAKDWASSPPPHQLAEAVRGIVEFSRTKTPDELFQMWRQLYKYTDPKMRDCGVNLLSYIVTKRWETLSDDQKNYVFTVLPTAIESSATSAWSTKNKVALLLSQLIAKHVTESWAKLVDSFMSSSQCDEIQAEITITKALSQGISIPDELKDERSETMKSQNWDLLLEHLFHLLDQHIGKYDTSPVEATKLQHYACAISIANTLAACAPLVEVKKLLKSVGGTDLIRRCEELLHHTDLIPALLAYLLEICSRVEDNAVSTPIFLRVFQLLETIPQQETSRQNVCSFLTSVKEALGTNFEDLKEAVISSLTSFELAGSISHTEYANLMLELFDAMVS